jgi:hypothetical protein
VLAPFQARRRMYGGGHRATAGNYAGIDRWNEKFDQVDEFLDEKKDYVKKYIREQRAKDAELKMQEDWLGITGKKQAANRSSNFVQKARKVKVTVTLDTVTLKLTLTQKFLDRPFSNSVVEPFLNAFNKKRPDEPPVTPDSLESIVIQGEKVENAHVRTNDLLPKDEMDITLHLPGTESSAPATAEEGEEEEEEGLIIEEN